MITYKNYTFDTHQVQAQISACTPGHNIPEYQVMLHGCNPLLPYTRQLDNLVEAYKQLQAVMPPTTPVFVRFFLSDAANQARQVNHILHHVAPAAVSIVQQPPLDGTKIAMWVYLLHHSVQTSAADSSLCVTHHGYTHYWTANRKTTGGNSEHQTHALLQSYTQDLGKQGCTLAANCLRTWFFIQNVDVNYAGLVQARGEHFRANGLTHHTHYITSTGIEGRDADPSVHVLLDA